MLVLSAFINFRMDVRRMRQTCFIVSNGNPEGFYFYSVQESQVSVEVAIPQRYHRAIMGPKGCRIQHLTREHEVQIKFPERDDSAAG